MMLTVVSATEDAGTLDFQRGAAIAYVAGLFPAPSETFVYREVRELCRRGWRVCPVSLNAPGSDGLAELANVAGDVYVLYGGDWLLAGLAELITRPIRLLGTLATAIGDALWPGERLGLIGRGKLLGQAMAGLGLARYLRCQGVQHIHCHFAHAPTTVGMYAARQLGIPFSFTGHANDIFQRRCLLKRKLRRAAFVSCISRWHREFYRQLNPAGTDKYRIIRCGVPLDAWPGRVQRNGGDRPFQLLCVARLVEKKGVESLIRAVATLDASRPWQLTIAGDGPLRPQLRLLAAQLRLGDRVTWKGAVSNDQVRHLMESADLFVLPCQVDSAGDRDGIPVVIMEAMASGLPVVAGRIPGIEELVVDGVTGLLCEGADSHSVAQAIAGLMADSGRCDQLATAGRRHVEAEFSLDGNVTRLEEAISSNLVRTGEKTDLEAVPA